METICSCSGKLAMLGNNQVGETTLRTNFDGFILWSALSVCLYAMQMSAS